MHWFKGLRILTVGDGDLSFSRSIIEHFCPATLVATTLDTASELVDKYQEHEFNFLQNEQVSVLTGFDVTKPDTWQQLTQHSFDLVIFQFPLVPATKGRADFEQGLAINTRNRVVLHKFLKHSQQYFLEPDGFGVAMITSKNVKPYTEWHIETAIQENTSMYYAGSVAFNSRDYPNYRLRNVDRDKQIKSTAATSYLWQQNKQAEQSLGFNNYKPKYLNHNEKYCSMCHAGPFRTPQEKQLHESSKKHQKMLEYEHLWEQYLQSEYQQ